MRLTLIAAILLGSCSVLAPCYAATASAAPAVAPMPCHAPSPKAPAPDCMAMPCCHEAQLQAAPALGLPAPLLVAVLTGELRLPASAVASVDARDASPPGGVESLRAARRLGRSPPPA